MMSCTFHAAILVLFHYYNKNNNNRLRGYSNHSFWSQSTKMAGLELLLWKFRAHDWKSLIVTTAAARATRRERIFTGYEERWCQQQIYSDMNTITVLVSCIQSKEGKSFQCKLGTSTVKGQNYNCILNIWKTDIYPWFHWREWVYKTRAYKDGHEYSIWTSVFIQRIE